MKSINKYLTILAAAPMLWACSADEGAMPGNDPKAAVTIYTYAPTDADLNPDNDVVVRFVTNDKATSLKYVALPTADVENTLANGGETALVGLVENQGTEISDVKGNSYYDVTLTDIHGDYTLVAVVNGKILSNRAKFIGLDWEVVKEGVFYYNNANVPPVEYAEASLEICTTDDTLYRINGVFGEGTAMKMNLLDIYGEDEDGKYQFFRVPPTPTPWTFGNYGQVSVRDVGYWQNNEAFVTSGGYESGLYEDGSAFFCIQWYVAAGNLGYGYSFFFPYD